MSSSARIPNGRLMKKIARHDQVSTSHPPSTGPKALVSADAPDQVPIDRPRSAIGKAALIMARLLGTSSAPPMPWIARALISTEALGASPHATEAAVNSKIP